MRTCGGIEIMYAYYYLDLTLKLYRAPLTNGGNNQRVTDQ